MSLMCTVMPGNINRVLASFQPFAAVVGDLFLDIRTYNPAEPRLHCIYTKISREIAGGRAVYPPGLYIYIDKIGDEKLVYHPTKSMDEVDELISIINIENIYSEQVMDLVGFILCCPPELVE